MLGSLWLGADGVARGQGGQSAEEPSTGASTSTDTEQPELRQYLQAMAEARLLAVETGTAEALRRLVAKGEAAFLAGRHDQAVVLLLEVVESPRFADFSELDEYASAQNMLAAALTRLGSLGTARRYLEQLIARGPQHPYFGPGVRRYSDVALELGDPEAAAARLAELVPGVEQHEDAHNELRYLRGRAHYDVGDEAAATRFFRAVTRRSRFYASARYLLGAIAARNERYAVAEEHFCEIAATGVEDRYAFYVDERFFNVRDLSRLGLGRVAHEQRRADDAFYYYFQVPQDSPRLAEAYFEAAYASYEGDEHDTAVDLLDQLQARFPGSPFVDEAAVLRGYVALSRCDFEQADRLFQRLIARFGPLLAEVERILHNPARRQRLYQELLAAERYKREQYAPRSRRSARIATLLALLEVDPEFYRLHADVRKLDAEAARAGRAHETLDAILAKLAGSSRPRAAAAERSELAKARADLQQQLDDGRLMTRALSAQLDAMRRHGAQGKTLLPLERQVAAAAKQLGKLRRRLQSVMLGARAAAPSDVVSDPVQALLARDVVQASELPDVVAELRVKLVAAANARALRALRELRQRLRDRLGRARIGRIDAVMGSKRRIELQIESLAAGRFPPELRDPLRVQGLLADDEEYWPFEGEDWPDEYQERAPQ